MSKMIQNGYIDAKQLDSAPRVPTSRMEATGRMIAIRSIIARFSSIKLPSGSFTAINRALFPSETGVSPIGLTPVLASLSRVASALLT